MTKEMYKELQPMASFFEWIDKHNKMAKVILWIEAAILAWTIYNYEFTTNI